MSTYTLPKQFAPLKYVDQQVVLEGRLKLSSLSRTGALLASEEGDVAVHLEFSRDEQNIPVIAGKIECDVEMACQRCLAGVERHVQADVLLGIVLSEAQMKNLPKAYDPLLLENESVDMLDLVEEELLLSLPMFAYHDDCQPPHVSEAPLVEEEADGDRKSPFDVLSRLKK